MNNMLKDGKRINSLYVDNGIKYVIYETNERDKFNKVGYIKIECSSCSMIMERKIKEHYFEKPLLCFSCLRKGERNPFYGKKHSDEFKNRLKEERKGTWGIGEKNGMYNRSVYDTWINKYGKEMADVMWNEKSTKHSQRMTGSGNPFFGKSHSKETIKKIVEGNEKYFSNPENIKKLSEIAKKVQNKLLNENPEKYIEQRRKAAIISNQNQMRYKKTAPEMVFENILKQNFIEYEYSPILDKYQYDFKIKNKRILIEVDGDYWHGNPEMYEEFNHIQLSKKKRDKEKEEFAKKHNFKLFRIWESDLTNKEKIRILIEKIKED